MDEIPTEVLEELLAELDRYHPTSLERFAAVAVALVRAVLKKELAERKASAR